MNRSRKDFMGGIEHYKLGLLPQAKMLLRDCIESDSRHAEAHNLLGIICYQCEEYADSLVWLQLAINLNPLEPNYLNNAGVAAHALQRHEEARTYFLRAMEITPEYHDPYNNLGNLLRDLFRFDEAILHFKQALNLKADFAEACFNLAMTLELKGHSIEAIFYLQQTIKMAPDHMQAHEQLARLLPKQMKHDEAADHASHAQWLGPRQKLFYKEMPVWTAPNYKGLLS